MMQRDDLAFDSVCGNRRFEASGSGRTIGLFDFPKVGIKFLRFLYNEDRWIQSPFFLCGLLSFSELLKVATCNLNQWAMEFECNMKNIKDSISQAKAAGAVIRLGPELEVTGYGCEEHFLELDTITHVWEYLKEFLLGDWTDGILCSIGMPVIKEAERDGMAEDNWVSLIAVHSDSWLISVAFYFGARFSFDKNERMRLFQMIKDLPTIYEVVTGKAKQSKDQSANSGRSKSSGVKARQSESQTNKASKRSPPAPPPREESESRDDEDGKLGDVKVLVTTVMPLPPAEEKELKETLQEITGVGKKVTVEQKVYRM
ncbi:hypothetical protein Bca4012_019255 [Brassica carinata]